MSTSKPRIGIIGCGAIMKAYMESLKKHDMLDVVACADLDVDRAKAKATEFNIPRPGSVDQLLADPEVEFVLNLTIPQAHQSVAMAALQAGKHVYIEKPLAVTREEAQAMQQLARSKGLRIGCAPDTFMGAGLQTCRKMIDSGKIGTPISAEVHFTLGAGYKDLAGFHWKRGAGVLMDMGPYYFTALVALLGPVTRLAAANRTQPRPDDMEKFPNWKELAQVPTHISTLLDFANSAVATATLSIEVRGWYDIHFKVQGTDGTLTCPDPNMFGGEVVFSQFGQEKERIKAEGPFSDQARGAGLVDMAYAVKQNRPHRANDEMGYHVLDIMCSILDSSEQGKMVNLQSTMKRPEPFWKFD
jgi:predicted dehydrogenase